MRIKILLLLWFFVITAALTGCIESQKISKNNVTPSAGETQIATPEPSITEPGLPAFNETNVDFDTWSRGYWSNTSYMEPYFRVITNYSKWDEFLNDQGYYAWLKGGPMRLEGTLFPGGFQNPKTIMPDDFNDHFIIAAMMGLKPYSEGAEIEIENISRINNAVNVTVRLYDRKGGAAVQSAPYHIIIVNKEQIPEDNITFDFIDIENGRVLARIAL